MAKRKIVTRPEYVITANALIWRRALQDIGGFNETITIAAGEDIDLDFALHREHKMVKAINLHTHLPVLYFLSGASPWDERDCEANRVVEDDTV